jgi:hypothetical protein
MPSHKIFIFSADRLVGDYIRTQVGADIEIKQTSKYFPTHSAFSKEGNQSPKKFQLAIFDSSKGNKVYAEDLRGTFAGNTSCMLLDNFEPTSEGKLSKASQEKLADFLKRSFDELKKAATQVSNHSPPADFPIPPQAAPVNYPARHRAAPLELPPSTTEPQIQTVDAAFDTNNHFIPVSPSSPPETPRV